MKLYKLIGDLEQDNNLHIARLLILLNVFAGKNGLGKINGKTKLVKLDFLLRYPVYLERALEKKKISDESVAIMSYERKSVESSMIRYHYGPWDPRYNKFINLLIGKGLCEVTVHGWTTCFGLTKKGFETSKRLFEIDEFDDYVNRATIIKRNFDQSGTSLMYFIYDTFPEIVALSKGEKISYEY